ncbi:hypothetical protein BDZ91DRAFT_750882, partial [Kalaharituber pfeilii]
MLLLFRIFGIPLSCEVSSIHLLFFTRFSLYILRRLLNMRRRNLTPITTTWGATSVVSP